MAPLSDQFDVVRTDRDAHRNVYTAFTKTGEWAGRVEAQHHHFTPRGDGPTTPVHVTGRGPVALQEQVEVAPSLYDIAVDPESWGKGLGDHLANYALSDVYRRAPGYRGDPSVIGTYLSPMSSRWRERLTGEHVPPAWGFGGDDDKWTPGSMTNHELLAEWGDEQAGIDEESSSPPSAAWRAGQRSPEPEGTVEDRRREFRA